MNPKVCCVFVCLFFLRFGGRGGGGGVGCCGFLLTGTDGKLFVFLGGIGGNTIKKELT